MNVDRARVPVRAALATALVLIVALPTLVTLAVHTAMQATARPVQPDLQAARAFLVDGAASWSDPSWRSDARAYLTSLGVDAEVQPAHGPLVVLTGGSPGKTGLARDKFVARDPENADVILGSGWVAAAPVAQAQGWGEPVAAGAVTLLAVLAAVALLVSRALVRPLAAMSRAALAVADGDLDVRLPRSPVREVADTVAAMERMSDRLQAALAQQAELEHERRLFVGAIAHDLRTPLFTLRGYLDGLKDGLATEPDRAMRYVEVCQQKVASLDRLVSDLFSFAQVELLDQQPRREPVDLDVLLRRCAGSLEPKLASRQVAIRVTGPPESCIVTGDEHLLTRVVDNLLDNAVRHTPEGGRIQLRWQREGGWVTFSVEDTGPGIASQDLPRLFQPLYRGESSRNRRTGGTGLGLSIAQRILRAHGGELNAANSAEGHAIFTATLPTGTAAR